MSVETIFDMSLFSKSINFKIYDFIIDITFDCFFSTTGSAKNCSDIFFFFLVVFEDWKLASGPIGCREKGD